VLVRFMIKVPAFQSSHFSREGIGLSGLGALHKTKCPLLMVFFSSLSLLFLWLLCSHKGLS
jgi:hypothetical protein